MEQQYGHKIPKLCKTLGFGLIKNNQLGNLDWISLKIIIFETKKLVLMMTSLVLGISFISKSVLISYLTSMKLFAIFVIIYRLVHWNNNNYVFLFMVRYMYLTDAKVAVIILFNHFSFSILYNVLLKNLRDIITSSTTFI